jgi:hypothetical protein
MALTNRLASLKDKHKAQLQTELEAINTEEKVESVPEEIELEEKK